MKLTLRIDAIRTVDDMESNRDRLLHAVANVDGVELSTESFLAIVNIVVTLESNQEPELPH